LPRRIPPNANFALVLLGVGLWWYEALEDQWLDPDMLLRGAACAGVAQVAFLCCTLIGGLLGGLEIAVLDIGSGRIRARWLIGHRIVLVRTIPLPIRFGFHQPVGGVPTARRWLLALVPALASAAMMIWTVRQQLHVDPPIGPLPPSWLRPATVVALLAFAWLVLIGGQLGVPTQLPIRLALWRPRRYAPATWVVGKAGRASIQRLNQAGYRGDPDAMQVELDALAGSISEHDAASLHASIRYYRSEFAAASTEAARHLDVAGVDDLSARTYFCFCTGVAVLAGQPVDPETAARARELCPALGYALQRDSAALVLALFALYDRDTELAREFTQQATRWASSGYDAGEAELVAAIAAAKAGDGREAQRSLRRGRRRAPSSPLVAVAERRLVEPPEITLTVGGVANV
jgi:hypothetical protein